MNNEPEADNSDPELPGESGHSVYRGLGLHACESSTGGKDLDVVSLGANPRSSTTRQETPTRGCSVEGAVAHGAQFRKDCPGIVQNTPELP